jgi:hypothetical protein
LQRLVEMMLLSMQCFFSSCASGFTERYSPVISALGMSQFLVVNSMNLVTVEQRDFETSGFFAVLMLDPAADCS